MHTLVFVLLSLTFSEVLGGKVLVFPVDGSHWINMKVLIEELHSKGHSITVIRPSNSWYLNENSPYYTSIPIKMGSFDKDFASAFGKRLIQLRRKGGAFFKTMMLGREIADLFSDMHREMCESLSVFFEDEKQMQSLEDSKYDLVLTDPAFGGGVLIAHRLGLPLVFNVRWSIRGEAHFAIAPSPLSYVPFPGAELTDKMTFIQRVQNVVSYAYNEYMFSQMTDPYYNAFCHRHFGPDVDYVTLFQDADIWLMRNDFTFEFPRPTMPNIVYMGGFQCKPSKPLPDDLEKFVQSAGDHGVVIMSLGTLFDELPTDIADEIAAAFSQLPQKVVWRHKGSRPSTLGNNTLLVDWMPQNDLLGHPKTKVFVAHGGTNGVQEAIYHGVPIVGLPLAFDQPDNLSRMQARGTAKVVDIVTMDRVVFLDALKEVLYEPTYRENMQRLSRIHRDQPMKPLDQAMFWIEYVMRHRGAPHLRTQSFRMSWLAYHSVDIIATLLASLLLMAIIIIFAIRFVCCKAFVKNKVKPE
uniref:UDP-glucuronosyltransferase n=1 Tax=Denticeps clupeoides TaxID=299321 RepID=A0AAY4CWK5_9TELE